MPFQENRLMIPTHRGEVIDAVFPRAAKELYDYLLGVVLDAQPVYRYQRKTTEVIHHKLEDGTALLT